MSTSDEGVICGCCSVSAILTFFIHVVVKFLAWHCGDRVAGHCLGPGQYLAPCQSLTNVDTLPLSPTNLGSMYDTSDCETFQAAGDSCAVVCSYGYE